MKAALVHAFGDVRIAEVPKPVPGPGEVLVRVRATGVCTSDTLRWYIEKKVAAGPIVLGHEPAGEIEEAGEGAPFRAGERVFLHHHAPCLRCRRCGRGEFVQCETWRPVAIHPGGCAEYVVVRAHSVAADMFRLPEGLSFRDAALIEPLACSVKAMRRAGVGEGSTVLVVGLGVMGAMEVLLARALGAAQVIGADFHPWRRAKGRELGCDVVLDPAEGPLAAQVHAATDGEGAEAVIVHPTSGEALLSGIEACARGGVVVLYSPAAPELRVPVSPHDLYFREITLAPSYSCGPDDTKASSELIASGRFDGSKVVTHVLPLGEAQRAFDLTAAAGESLKVLLEP